MRTRKASAGEAVQIKVATATAVAAAAGLLQQGYLVAFPTDTVYGVGTSAFDEEAVTRLFLAKERPLHKGIPILLADLTDLDKVARQIPAAARAFMGRFWPGPLTLVVPRRPELPANLSPNGNIAVRIPDCSVARALIRAAGGAVAATSANLSGKPPALTAAEAGAALAGTVSLVLDGGLAPQGQASTVVDCTTPEPCILRPGPVTAADLGL